MQRLPAAAAPTAVRRGAAAANSVHRAALHHTPSAPAAAPRDTSTRASRQPSGSRSRSSQLFDLDEQGAYDNTQTPPPPPTVATDADSSSLLDDGWGVVVPSGASSVTAVATAAKKQKKDKKGPAGAGAAAAVGTMALAGAAAGSGKPRTRTPFMDKDSPEGMLSLGVLQAQLELSGRVAHDDALKARVKAEAEQRRQRLEATRGRKRDWVDPAELDPGETAEEFQMPMAVFNLEADGTTELIKYDNKGNVIQRSAPGSQQAEEDDEDPLAFLDDDEDDDDELGDGDGGGGAWAVAAAAASARQAGSGAASTSKRAPAGKASSRRGAHDSDEDDDDNDGMPGSNPLADEELEWGLDELGGPGGRRPSLMRQLGIIGSKSKGADKAQKGAAAAPGAAAAAGGEEGDDDLEGGLAADVEERETTVAWGGTGGASGVDMEAQEALLARIYKPHKVRELMAHQRAAEEEMAALKKRTSGRGDEKARVNGKMRVIAGSAAGRPLANGTDGKTRPMMEKVRAAIFNMIQSQAGTAGGLPPARWLDLFAGTGSVGLEALSRGVRECHFIELDPWITKKVLGRNIATCGFERQSVVHTMKAEDFLRKSIQLPRFAGGAFDFLSVCPPYLLVSYPEIFALLERSPLLHEGSLVFVEYPKQLSAEVPATLGPLVTVRDRKYGRTLIRVYGPGGGDDEE